METYYDVLNVGREASKEEIKRQYRKLAKKYHPDKNEGNKDAEKKFKKISEAYGTLSNERKKREYDRGGIGDGFNWSDPFNVFKSVRQRSQHLNSDIKIRLNISIEEAFSGTTKTIRYESIEVCKGCGGNGSKQTSDVVRCQTCNGSGRIKINLPIFISSGFAVCKDCGGGGTVFKNPCVICNGERSVLENKQVDVRVPKGVQGECCIHLEGKGNSNQNGQSGDLIVSICLYGDGFYKLNRNDVHCSIPIPLHSFICGGKIKVPSLHGEQEVKIRAYQKESVKIKGMGFPRLRSESEYGDFFIKVYPEIPKNIPNDILEQIKRIKTNKTTYPNYSKMMEKR